MAQPLKDGLDYFSVNVAHDEKMALIEAEFGVLGFGVIIKLLQKIYAQGYYATWTNEVALLFSRQSGLGGNVVSEILSAAVKRGIFHGGLLQRHHVLTSVEIQENFFNAVKRRKQVRVDTRYLLVEPGLFLDDAHIYRVNVDIYTVNACSYAQSRVEESRVEESKGESAPQAAQPRPRPCGKPCGKPGLPEVLAYGKSEGMQCDPGAFFDYYEARGWQYNDGKPVANWKAALKSWERREGQFGKQAGGQKHDPRDPAATAGSSLDYGKIDAMIDEQFDGEGGV